MEQSQRRIAVLPDMEDGALPTAAPNGKLRARRGLLDVTNQNPQALRVVSNKDRLQQQGPIRSKKPAERKERSEGPKKIQVFQEEEPAVIEDQAKARTAVEEQASPVVEAAYSVEIAPPPRKSKVFVAKQVAQADLMFFPTPLTLADLPDAYETTEEKTERGRTVRKGKICADPVLVNDVLLGFLRYRGHLYVFESKCTHQGGNLCNGDIEDLGIEAPLVVCPMHHWKFSALTGQAHFPSHGTPLQTFQYRIEPDGKISVGFEHFAPRVFNSEDF